CQSCFLLFMPQTRHIYRVLTFSINYALVFAHRNFLTNFLVRKGLIFLVLARSLVSRLSFLMAFSFPSMMIFAKLMISFAFFSMSTALNCQSDATIFHDLLSTYNKMKVPGKDGTEILVEGWLQQVTAISETTSDVQLDIFMAEVWLDPGLRFDYA